MYVSGRKVEFFSNRTASLNKSIIFVSIKVIPKDYNLVLDLFFLWNVILSYSTAVWKTQYSVTELRVLYLVTHSLLKMRNLTAIMENQMYIGPVVCVHLSSR